MDRFFRLQRQNPEREARLAFFANPGPETQKNQGNAIDPRVAKIMETLKVTPDDKRQPLVEQVKLMKDRPASASPFAINKAMADLDALLKDDEKQVLKEFTIPAKKLQFLLDLGVKMGWIDAPKGPELTPAISVRGVRRYFEGTIFMDNGARISLSEYINLLQQPNISKEDLTFGYGMLWRWVTQFLPKVNLSNRCPNPETVAARKALAQLLESIQSIINTVFGLQIIENPYIVANFLHEIRRPCVKPAQIQGAFREFARTAEYNMWVDAGEDVVMGGKRTQVYNRTTGNYEYLVVQPGQQGLRGNYMRFKSYEQLRPDIPTSVGIYENGQVTAGDPRLTFAGVTPGSTSSFNGASNNGAPEKVLATMRDLNKLPPNNPNTLAVKALVAASSSDATESYYGVQAWNALTAKYNYPLIVISKRTPDYTQRLIKLYYDAAVKNTPDLVLAQGDVMNEYVVGSSTVTSNKNSTNRIIEERETEKAWQRFYALMDKVDGATTRISAIKKALMDDWKDPDGPKKAAKIDDFLFDIKRFRNARNDGKVNMQNEVGRLEAFWRMNIEPRLNPSPLPVPPNSDAKLTSKPADIDAAAKQIVDIIKEFDDIQKALAELDKKYPAIEAKLRSLVKNPNVLKLDDPTFATSAEAKEFLDAGNGLVQFLEWLIGELKANKFPDADKRMPAWCEEWLILTRKKVQGWQAQYNALLEKEKPKVVPPPAPEVLNLAGTGFEKVTDNTLIESTSSLWEQLTEPQREMFKLLTSTEAPRMFIQLDDKNKITNSYLLGKDNKKLAYPDAGVQAQIAIINGATVTQDYLVKILPGLLKNGVNSAIKNHVQGLIEKKLGEDKMRAEERKKEIAEAKPILKKVTEDLRAKDFTVVEGRVDEGDISLNVTKGFNPPKFDMTLVFSKKDGKWEVIIGYDNAPKDWVDPGALAPDKVADYVDAEKRAAVLRRAAEIALEQKGIIEKLPAGFSVKVEKSDLKVTGPKGESFQLWVNFGETHAEISDASVPADKTFKMADPMPYAKAAEWIQKEWERRNAPGKKVEVGKNAKLEISKTKPLIGESVTFTVPEGADKDVAFDFGVYEGLMLPSKNFVEDFKRSMVFWMKDHPDSLVIEKNDARSVTVKLLDPMEFSLDGVQIAANPETIPGTDIRCKMHPAAKKETKPLHQVELLSADGKSLGWYRRYKSGDAMKSFLEYGAKSVPVKNFAELSAALALPNSPLLKDLKEPAAPKEEKPDEKMKALLKSIDEKLLIFRDALIVPVSLYETPEDEKQAESMNKALDSLTVAVKALGKDERAALTSQPIVIVPANGEFYLPGVQKKPDGKFVIALEPGDMDMQKTILKCLAEIKEKNAEPEKKIAPEKKVFDDYLEKLGDDLDKKAKLFFVSVADGEWYFRCDKGPLGGSLRFYVKVIDGKLAMTKIEIGDRDKPEKVLEAPEAYKKEAPLTVDAWEKLIEEMSKPKPEAPKEVPAETYREKRERLEKVLAPFNKELNVNMILWSNDDAYDDFAPIEAAIPNVTAAIKKLTPVERALLTKVQIVLMPEKDPSQPGMVRNFLGAKIVGVKPSQGEKQLGESISKAVDLIIKFDQAQELLKGIANTQKIKVIQMWNNYEYGDCKAVKEFATVLSDALDGLDPAVHLELAEKWCIAVLPESYDSAMQENGHGDYYIALNPKLKKDEVQQKIKEIMSANRNALDLKIAKDEKKYLEQSIDKTSATLKTLNPDTDKERFNQSQLTLSIQRQKLQAIDARIKQLEKADKK